MTGIETAKFLATLREFFPNGPEIKDSTVKAWHMILEDFPYEAMNATIKEVVLNWEGYTMPPPGAFAKVLRKANEADLTDLWNEADRLICKGTVLTQYEFEQASPEIQRYFGSINRIRELALSPPEATDYEKNHFMKAVPAMRESNRAKETLGGSVGEVIGEVAERMRIE